MFEKWKKSSLKGKGGTLETTLADIVRGIQYCVNSASEIVDRQYVAQLDQYFENGRPLVYPVELQMCIRDSAFALRVAGFCLLASGRGALPVQCGVCGNIEDGQREAGDGDL